MSSFDKTWLELREPADRAARDMTLVTELAASLDHDGSAVTILDIGCGTGSTWRALAQIMPERAAWRLLDYDPLLLDEAERRIGTDDAIVFRQHDLNNLAELPIAGVSVITASALFDLCSEAFCDRFVSRMAEHSCSLYAALNYNGIIQWSSQHPLDDAAVADFNAHQRTDKGFGSALGPDATQRLARNLNKFNYRVRIADSPWRMGHEQALLQAGFLEGFRQPLSEIGTLSASEIDSWIGFRISAIPATGGLCEVGHTDLLAIAG